MIIGCPKEIKAFENRVALIPGSVKALVEQGAEVLIESNAGLGSNISDQDYLKAGAVIKNNAQEIWESANIKTNYQSKRTA